MQAFKNRCRDHRPRWRFVCLFLAYLAAFYVAAFNPASGETVSRRLFVPLTETIAAATSWLLNALGEETAVAPLDAENPARVKVLGRQYGVVIHNGCNGVFAAMIFLAALLAYPLPLMARVFGAILGLALVQGVNLARTVALFLVGAYRPEYFHDAHVFLAPWVVIVCIMAFWTFWIDRWNALPARFQAGGKGRKP
jgi:exosortase/archaeosortase family protein